MGRAWRQLATRWLPLLLLCGAVAHYLAFIVGHAPNIPYQDDIVDFVRFMVALDDADGLGQSLATMFAQYNDHRTMASRLLVYAAFLAQGVMDFQVLAVIANLGLLLLLALFLLRVRDAELRWLWLLTAALLLLNLRAYTLVLWSQAAFAYFFVFLYASACIFALHRVTPARLVLAITCCTLANLTLASGQVVWLLGGASLLHQCLLRRDRPWRYLAAWCVAAVAVLAIWRAGFIPADLSALSRLLPDHVDGAPLPDQLLRYAGFFLAILGSALSHGSTALAIACGAVLLVTLALLSLRALRGDDIRLELCCWFAVASAAAVTLGRAKWLPPAYVLDTRYSFLSVFLLAALAVLLLARAAPGRVLASWCVATLAATYSAWTFIHFTPPIQALLDTRTQAFNAGQYHVVTVPPGETNAIVATAVQRGLYQPPCRPYPQCLEAGGPGQTEPTPVESR